MRKMKERLFCSRLAAAAINATESAPTVTGAPKVTMKAEAGRD